MNTSPMRLIRPEREETRQERELRRIRERRTVKPVFAEGEIDNTPTANVIPVDEVLKRSYRKTDDETN